MGEIVKGVLVAILFYSESSTDLWVAYVLVTRQPRILSGDMNRIDDI